MRAPWNVPVDEVRGALLTAATMAVAVVASAALLVGCASTDGIAPKQALLTPQSAGVGAAQVTWPATRWWNGFGDAKLDGLVEQALAG